MMNKSRDVSVLMGRTLTGIANLGDELVFTVDDGTTYRMYHSPDCCEDVRIEDIVGDLNDLIGSPLTMAEEAVSKDEDPEDYKPESEWRDSFTWTFYKFATLNGYVTIRWLGVSNGYYSENVDFVENQTPPNHVLRWKGKRVRDSQPYRWPGGAERGF